MWLGDAHHRVARHQRGKLLLAHPRAAGWARRDHEAADVRCSRAVSDPRGVLTEFGGELADDVERRVLDSTEKRGIGPATSCHTCDTTRVPVLTLSRRRRGHRRE